MRNGFIALTGFTLGAAAMYFADPQRGARRRARLRDVATHTSHTFRHAAATTTRDAENRLSGLAARARGYVAEHPAPDDDVLTARVRSRLGRLVSHPRAIEVKAASGRVMLSGPVFEAEVGQLLDGVRAVGGVTDIDDRLQPHAEAGDISALQGSGPLRLATSGHDWIRWAPASGVLIGAAGLAAIAVASQARRPQSEVAG